MATLSILAVEDDAMSRVTLLSLADRLAFDITVAHSLSSALAALATRAFDLILIEWHMVEDQNQVAQLKRLNDRFGDGKVSMLAVTAFPFDITAASGQAGPDAYLVKPYTIEQFVDKVGLLTGVSLADRATAETSQLSSA